MSFFGCIRKKEEDQNPKLLVVCPTCGKTDDPDWIDALADIIECRQCGFAGRGFKWVASPPGTMAVMDEQCGK